VLRIPRKGDDTNRIFGQTADMTTKTLVSVYKVDDDGATGSWLGSGSLIHPPIVLVHPPLSRDLADNCDSISLRVGIASSAPESYSVEVIDARLADVWTDGEREALVALELVRPSASPVEPLPTLSHDVDAAVEVLYGHLESLPAADGLTTKPNGKLGSSLVPPVTEPAQSQVMCTIFGIGCDR